MNSMDTYIPSTFDNTSLSQLREDAKKLIRTPRPTRSVGSLRLCPVNMLFEIYEEKATQRSELFNSEAAKSFESMFDQEIANKVSYADGIGLADTIKRQLFPNDSQKSFKSGGFDIHQRAKAHAINSYQNQANMPRRMSVTDILSIGGNSLKNNQSALAVVSNNIANVNTEGYVRQELDIKENKPSRNGTVFLGSGAIASGVKRAYDSLIEASLRSSNTDLSGQTPLIDFTNRLIDIMGEKKQV